VRIIDVKASIVFGRSVFVQVFTDEGITGLGECSPMHLGALVHFVNVVLKSLCIGKNPLEVDKLWSTMFYDTYKLGDTGLKMEAISGIDIALWDIFGKVTGLPIVTLLGGCYREKVQMYASLGAAKSRDWRDRRTPLEMARLVEENIEKGFRAIKIRMHWEYNVDVDPATDWAMFRECKQVTGDAISLSFDANNGYSEATAIQQGRRFETLGIYHFEEPVMVDDYAAYARVADALDTPIAAGEHEYTRFQFRELIQRGRVDIIQPDIVKCGGFTEIRKIAALGEVHHKHLVPHMTMPSVGTAANIHFIASLRDATRPQELTRVDQQLNSLFKEPLIFEDGFLTVPPRPGLGLELDEEAFARACADE
jgi:L-alanine-DL-glutamate epimerase-like enolase superfamily enzyme